jgi:hypothetical protein
MGRNLLYMISKWVEIGRHATGRKEPPNTTTSNTWIMSVVRRGFHELAFAYKLEFSKWEEEGGWWVQFSPVNFDWTPKKKGSKLWDRYATKEVKGQDKRIRLQSLKLWVTISQKEYILTNCYLKLPVWSNPCHFVNATNGFWMSLPHGNLIRTVSFLHRKLEKR